MTSAQLPIIDLSKAKENRTELAKAVVDALENVGFLYVDNVQGVDYDKLVKCCQWFFSRPSEEKKRLTRQFWEPNNKNVYRGYHPVAENHPSRKEGFEFARDVPADDKTVSPGNWFYENSVWPIEDGTFPFKQILQETYDRLHEAALEILRLTALGIGIEENSYEYLFTDKPMTTLRLLHYPPWNSTPPPNAIIEDGKVISTPDHTDTIFLTLLYTCNFKGLEVMMLDGKWAEVEPRPQSFIMNIGDVFSRMMGGRFKASRHRVIDIGVDRFSVPFFLEPGYDGDIGVNFMSKFTGKGPAHEVERYGPWLLHRMKYEKQYVEYKVLPDVEQ